MTDRVKNLDEPVLLSELRSLPRRYLRPDGGLDSARVRLDLGILTDEDLKAALLALYRTDVGISHRVDDRLVRALLARLVGATFPPIQVPPGEESAWVSAEAYCSGCPGSEERAVFEGGPILPLCHARERIERWEGCLKFRENLFRAAEEGKGKHEESLAYARSLGLVEEFERAVDAVSDEVR